MSRRLLTISALVAVLAVFASAQTAVPTSQLARCSASSDCASATCCGVSVCVNRQYAPSENACTSVECPRETPGPVTTCECSDNICRTTTTSIVVINTVAPGQSPAPTPTVITPVDDLLTCSSDGDCGMQTCCEANLCIAKRFAPDCTDITSRFCSALAFDCRCSNNRCARVETAAPPTPSPTSPATTVVDDGANTDTDSPAYSVPLAATVATAVVAIFAALQ